TGHAETEAGGRLIRLELSGGRRGIAGRDAGGPAQEEERRALVRLPRVVLLRTDDHVGVAVAVHVARTRDGVPEYRVGLVRFELRRRRGWIARCDPRRTSEEHEHRALVRL